METNKLKNNMTIEHILILGGRGSGKTTLSKKMASVYKNSAYLSSCNIPHEERVFMHQINENCECIVFDDVSRYSELQRATDLLDGFMLHRKCMKPVFINPAIILVCSIGYENIPEHIKEQFHIIYPKTLYLQDIGRVNVDVGNKFRLIDYNDSSNNLIKECDNCGFIHLKNQICRNCCISISTNECVK